MKIGLDISSISHGAGIGRYTGGLASSLAEVARQKGSPLELVYFSRRPLPPGLEPGAFRPAEIIVIPGNRVLFDQTKLTRALRKSGLDVYHSPDYIIPRADHGVPSVVTVHDLSFYDCPESVSPQALLLYRKFVPSSLEKADIILADSEFTAGRIRDRFTRVAERVRVIHPGITPRIGQTTVIFEHELTHPYLLLVGTIEPRKNFPLALSVFRKMKEQRKTLEFVIIGRSGRGARRILAEIRRTPGVRYMNRADDSELETAYRRAAIFIYPSLYEGFGYPPVEAMAWGCPVLAANTSALPESVNGGGLLVEPTHDAFLAAGRQLLDDPAFRAVIVDQGRAQAEKFRWKYSVARVLAAYEEAVRRYSKKRPEKP
ncbi:MAG: glycosyltransferase family 4 protein [bacterium]